MASFSTPETNHNQSHSQPGVYECEIRLKFRILEDKETMGDREHLLDMLIDAFTYGPDEYLEYLNADVNAQEISELNASPQMRRQLIRLRSLRSSA